MEAKRANLGQVNCRPGSRRPSSTLSHARLQGACTQHHFHGRSRQHWLSPHGGRQQRRRLRSATHNAGAAQPAGWIRGHQQDQGAQYTEQEALVAHSHPGLRATPHKTVRSLRHQEALTSTAMTVTRSSGCSKSQATHHFSSDAAPDNIAWMRQQARLPHMIV